MAWVRIKDFNLGKDKYILINTKNVNIIMKLPDDEYIIIMNNKEIVTDEEGKRKICKIKI